MWKKYQKKQTIKIYKENSLRPCLTAELRMEGQVLEKDGKQQQIEENYAECRGYSLQETVYGYSELPVRKVSYAKTTAKLMR